MNLRSLPARARALLRRLRYPALVAALAAGALALALASSDDKTAIDRAGSESLGHPNSGLPADPIPASYAVTYSVGAGDAPASSERVVIRRPFEGRVERAGETIISSFGRLIVLPKESTPVALAIPPEPAVGDLGVVSGAGTRRERRRITALDEECDVFRLAGGTDDNHRDVCIDARRLVLEDVEVAKGEPVARRIATAVDLNPDIDGDTFQVTDLDPAPPDQGGGSLVEVRAGDASPATTFSVGDVLPGFRHQGRYAFVPPRHELWPDPLGGQRRSSVVDVWTRDLDLLVLEQGQTLGRVSAFEPDPERQTVDLASLPGAEFLSGLRGAEVRAAFDDGRYLRLSGTLPVPHLLEMADSITAVPDDG